MRDEFKNTNWHSRGYLNHYDADEKFQFITYRLSDSIPKTKLDRIMKKYDKKEQKLSRRIEIENILDNGFGSGILKYPKAAQIVVDNWKYFDKIRYELHAFVVMPNHVHLLIKTTPEFSVGDLVKSWKSYTAKSIRKTFANHFNADYQSALPERETQILQEGKPFWQREYWDRFIRDEKHYLKSIDYIHNNPVKAGLCKSSKDWMWSSSSPSL